jgi:hypothetical protein
MICRMMVCAQQAWAVRREALLGKLDRDLLIRRGDEERAGPGIEL